VEAGIAVELEPLPATSEGGAAGPGVEILLSAAGVPATGLDEPQMRAAIRVVEALDGNPLALELAAARLSVLGLRGLAERLDQPLALLGSSSGTDASMKDAIEWSFQLLTPEEQRALAECSVFRGPFPAGAAEAVVVPDPRGSTIDRLAALRRSSLLGEVVGASDVRFVLARTVREFAYGKLTADAAAAATSRRDAYCASHAWTLAQEMMGTGSASAIARLAEDADQILQAIESTLGGPEPPTAGRARIGLRAAVGLEAIVAMRGPAERYLELLDRGLRAIENEGDEELVGHALRSRGALVGRRGAYEPARADLERACAIGATCGARDLEAEARLALGVLHQRFQRFDDAALMYRSVLDAPRGGPGLRAEARALSNLAAIAHDEQRFDEARQMYEESVSLLETIGDDRIAALVGVNSAVLLQERGERAEARRRYARAAEALAALGDDWFLGFALGNLAMLDLEEGDLDGALSHAERARTLLARAGDLRSETLAVARLAAILAMRGRTREALGAAVLAERMSLRHDSAVRGTVRLLRAFVDWGKARDARLAGDRPTAENALFTARARCSAATTASRDGAAVTNHSDDARTALRVLLPILERGL
jgi:tetratricopeptide (TPR) repeat protein